MIKTIAAILLALALYGCGGDQNVTVSGGGATSTSGTDNSQTVPPEEKK